MEGECDKINSQERVKKINKKPQKKQKPESQKELKEGYKKD